MTHFTVPAAALLTTIMTLHIRQDRRHVSNSSTISQWTTKQRGTVSAAWATTTTQLSLLSKHKDDMCVIPCNA